MTRRGPALLLATIVGLLGACGDTADDSATGLSGTIHVLAASSLTEVFTDLGDAFRTAHPATDVVFNFAASSALAEQIVQGAPADVFVGADEQNMSKVVDASKAADPTVIARNRLAIAVEPGNPQKVQGIADLARVSFVLCSPAVPCGKLGAKALEAAEVQATPKSLEENVKAVVAKVSLGEVDAGIVYVTDVKAAKGKVDGVEISIAANRELEAIYTMAVTTEAEAPAVAAAFAGYVASAEGQEILAGYGFMAP